jgi:hypothetical protein
LKYSCKEGKRERERKREILADARKESKQVQHYIFQVKVGYVNKITELCDLTPINRKPITTQLWFISPLLNK